MNRYVDEEKDLEEILKIRTICLPTDKTPGFDCIISFIRLMTGLIFIVWESGFTTFGNEFS